MREELPGGTYRARGEILAHAWASRERVAADRLADSRSARSRARAPRRGARARGCGRLRRRAAPRARRAPRRSARRRSRLERLRRPPRRRVPGHVARSGRPLAPLVGARSGSARGRRDARLRRSAPARACSSSAIASNRSTPSAAPTSASSSRRASSSPAPARATRSTCPPIRCRSRRERRPTSSRFARTTAATRPSSSSSTPSAASACAPRATTSPKRATSRPSSRSCPRSARSTPKESAIVWLRPPGEPHDTTRIEDATLAASYIAGAAFTELVRRRQAALVPRLRHPRAIERDARRRRVRALARGDPARRRRSRLLRRARGSRPPRRSCAGSIAPRTAPRSSPCCAVRSPRSAIARCSG